MTEYTTVEVCRLAKASFRQVDYWCRLGILQPRYVTSEGLDAPEQGSGTQRRFPFAEALKAAAIVQMLDAGLIFEVAARLARGNQWAAVVVGPLPYITVGDETPDPEPEPAERAS